MEKKDKIIVYVKEPGHQTAAMELSLRLGCAFTSEPEEVRKYALHLCFSDEGLFLTDGRLKLMGDFSQMKARVRPDNLSRELLVRAARSRDQDSQPWVVDATAGLGEDSFLLAAAGFHVTMYEYNPVIAVLLGDALERALSDPALMPVAEKMVLLNDDSLDALPQLKSRPDVVYLDPMFPERQKSALVKKKFQLLGRLEFPCAGEESLLRAALLTGSHKIVIKRPLKAQPLGGLKADYSISGSTIRYDCLLPAANKAAQIFCAL